MAHVPKRESAKAPGKTAGPPEAAGADPAGLLEAGDAELVRRAQAGEMAAYEALVRRHQKRVLAIVSGILRRREDIEDVAQQVFIKVFVSLKRFDMRSTFPTWLYKVTVNECWDYLRKKRARKLVYEADLSEEQAQQLQSEGDLGNPSPGRAGKPADAARQAEARDMVERLLGELSREEQAMLVLKEVEGFSVEEIGEVLGLNVNTVKVKLFRARGRLVQLYRRRLEKRPTPPGAAEKSKRG